MSIFPLCFGNSHSNSSADHQAETPPLSDRRSWNDCLQKDCPQRVNKVQNDDSDDGLFAIPLAGTEHPAVLRDIAGETRTHLTRFAKKEIQQNLARLIPHNSLERQVGRLVDVAMSAS